MTLFFFTRPPQTLKGKDFSKEKSPVETTTVEVHMSKAGDSLQKPGTEDLCYLETRSFLQ